MRKALLLLVAMFLTACSGNVSGTVYFTNGAGTAMRLSEQDVVLVAATPEIDSAMKKAVANFLEAFAPAEAERKAAWDAELASVGNLDASERAAARVKAATAATNAAKDTYIGYTVKLIALGKEAEAHTDANGHFEFKSVRRGRHYLYVSRPVIVEGSSYRFDHWLVPFELKFGSQLQDVSPSSSVWPFPARVFEPAFGDTASSDYERIVSRQP